MSKSIKVRDMILGEGLPKICVPIVEKTAEEVLASARRIVKEEPDLIEWRLDFLEAAKEPQKVADMAVLLRNEIGEIPLLATFRTKAEGGEQELSEEEYVVLYKELIKGKMIDLVDVEVFLSETTIRTILDLAHAQQIAVIGSNHDFYKTPQKAEIIRRLCLMQELGMDVAKMAVMPQNTEDLLTLLDATRIMKEEHDKTPVITMSMSGKGVLSRMTGEIFGSALTFAAVGKVSAPGQIPIKELRAVMEVIHVSQ